ncbi:MAG: TonB-dependent receptor [Bryobacterales bacterium]|nr:TonB-dependent receptor [Bryobacterales bacterium]
MKSLLPAVLLLNGAVLSLMGQGTPGTITGRVMDPTGAAIPGAAVTATNVATNITNRTVSTETGDYTLQVYPGTYRVVVEADGFKRYLRDGILMTAASTVRIDLTPELGSVAETIEVQGMTQSVQTENAKVSTSVENKVIDELPLVVGGALRSPFDLVKIAAQQGGDGTAMRLGGAQAAAWDATLDGVSVTTNRSADTTEIAYNTPSLEAITDFAVDTNGFKAEYGQAGGGVITFSSRSGTNDFHGTVYNFLRNEKLDARGFFAPTRAVYKQNDFGAAGGGPIIRNRTFFYAAYEGFRNRVGANDIILSVPTPEMYQGNFSNWVSQQNQLLQIYDPATTRRNPAGAGFIRDPFPNNQIPTNRFSTFARQAIPFGQTAQPNRGGQPGTIGYVRQNFITSTGTLVEPQNKWSLKIDHNFNANHRVAYFMNFSDYARTPGAGGPPGLPLPLYNGPEAQDFTTKSFRMSYDWVISPNLLNHISAGGNTFFKASFSPNYQGAGGTWGSQICLANVIDCSRNFPLLTFSEFSTWGGNAMNGTEQPLWSIKDDLSWNRGKHSLKFGFSFQSQRAIGFGEQQIMGGAGFSFLSTGVPADTTFRSGSSFASFLLGEAINGGTETERYAPQYYPYYGFYAQDDWRVTQRLTLNFGLRYEFTLPPRSPLDILSDFTPDRPNPRINNFPGALRFAGFGPGRENSSTLVPGWFGGWSPRLGLAYQLNDKTTMRFSAGRAFSKITVVAGSGHFAGFIGTYRFQSIDQGVTPAFRTDDGLPAYPLPVTLDPGATLDPAFANNQNIDHWQLSDAARAPENYFWTFNIQREVAPSTVLEVGYNAMIGNRLQAGLVNLNQFPTPLWDNFVGQYGFAGARALLNSQILSATARDANIPIPYPNFTDPSVQQQRTVAQALRPFPQYLSVNTGAQGGDKSGHSTYHAMVLKLQRRYVNGLALEWNYTLSKIMTDADSYRAGNNQSRDQYNRRVEKSIGQFDQTHMVKFSTVYELPFGRGKRFGSGSSGVVNAVFGGWRLAAIQSYASGLPIRVSRNNPLPLFNGYAAPTINGYDNWRGAIQGDSFDPGTDLFIDRAAFPTQENNFGNATRHNPKVRSFPQLNENISLGKTFQPLERLRVDFRWEAFNLFNRTVFGTGNLNLNSNVFGVVVNQSNTPRQQQVGLKLYF